MCNGRWHLCQRPLHILILNASLLAFFAAGFTVLSCFI